MGITKTAVHPSGITITFTEEDHKYVDSRGMPYKSVTTFIHENFPVFDTEGISAKYAAKRGLNQEDVKREWKENGERAAAYGTRVHAFAEAKLCGYEIPQPTDEMDCASFEAVRAYIENDLLKHNTFLESEKIIFSPKLYLSGTIDLLVKDRSGRLFILDWKTNKELKLGNGYQSGLGCLEHLDDCNFVHYSIQLNLYRRLLEDEGYFRSAKDAGMALLFVRRSPSFKVEVYPVDRMDDEIDCLLGSISR